MQSDVTSRPVPLLVVGAPKCGTSSLFGWLECHPKIAPAFTKETYILMDQGDPNYRRKDVSVHHGGRTAFDDMFEVDGAAYELEGTTLHYFQQTALDFANAAAGCRVVFVLRSPSQRLLSHFRYFRDTRAQILPEYSFDKYADDLLTDKIRGQGAQFRDHRVFDTFCRQLHLNDYAHHIERWTQSVGKERLRIVLFEDLKQQPGKVVDCVFSWLDLDPAEATIDFAAKNATYRVIAPRLHNLAWKVGSLLPATRIKQMAKSLYLGTQTRFAKQDAAFETGLARLNEHYAPIITRLDQVYPSLGIAEKWARKA